MRDAPRMMEGTVEFFPFCYLLVSADTSLEAAELLLQHHQGRGMNYHLVNAVISSAFAVEAVVNHIGQDKVPEKFQRERSLRGWRKKLELVAAIGSQTPNFGSKPFAGVLTAFDVRDKLAHGKTWVGQVCYLDTGAGEGKTGFPDWLQPCFDSQWVRGVYEDATEAVRLLLEWAGYDTLAQHRMGGGEFAEVRGTSTLPDPPVWSIKNL